MPERVDARDVLDANARIKRTFSAQQVGYFRKAGPNPWDDYEFVRTLEEPFAPYPGTEIQLERSGTQFRVRKDGRVVRVKWTPGEDDPESVRDDPAARRRYFIETYLEQYDDAPGIGAGAMIARKLT
jgi:hypothetical protein